MGIHSGATRIPVLVESIEDLKLVESIEFKSLGEKVVNTGLIILGLISLLSGHHTRSLRDD